MSALPPKADIADLNCNAKYRGGTGILTEARCPPFTQKMIDRYVAAGARSEMRVTDDAERY